MGLSAPAHSASIEPPAETTYKQPQVAVRGSVAAVAWGSGNTILFAKSADGGRRFGTPVKVAEAGMISLGMHRGPRIAMTPSAIVISAVYGAKGRGADGDLLAFRSTDGGATWSKGVRVNDRAAAAREGLHAMAADGEFVYAVWLDDRDGGKELYGASSSDGGATWSGNRRIYHSPDGHICECCHPSLAVRAGGREIYAMFRNWLGGSRDLYLATSVDGGMSFEARKLGEGTWPLNACPMDGGGLAVDSKGPLTVWRRDSTVFMARPGSPEIKVGTGKDPALAGDTVLWSAADGLHMKHGAGKSVLLDASGAYPSAAGDANVTIAAWEDHGGIRIEMLPRE
jgi:hypothetical protein